MKDKKQQSAVSEEKIDKYLEKHFGKLSDPFYGTVNHYALSVYHVATMFKRLQSLNVQGEELAKKRYEKALDYWKDNPLQIIQAILVASGYDVFTTPKKGGGE